MDKLLEALDLGKIAATLSPAAMIAIWRSFYLKGAFPSVGKDDIGAFVLIGATYYLFLRAIGINTTKPSFLEDHRLLSVVFLLVLPTAVGLALGFLEGEDWIGRTLRRARLRVPHPQATAWQDLFREIRKWDLIIIYTSNDVISGRWAPGSSASLDNENLDLFLSELGMLDSDGAYRPKKPPRGIYVRIDQIEALEVIPTGAVNVKEAFLAKLGRKYRAAIGA